MAKRKTRKRTAKRPTRARAKRDAESDVDHDKGREEVKSASQATGSDLLSGVAPITPRPLSEWIVDAYHMMTEGKKTLFKNLPGTWDDLTLTEKLEPEEGKFLRTLIGNAIRGGVWNLVAWANDSSLPEVKRWADSLLADIVMCLEKTGYAKSKGVTKKSADFQARWNQLKRDGRGESDLAVIPMFAMEVMQQAELLLEHVMRTAKDGVIDLATVTSKAERELWRFVAYMQKKMDATGMRFNEPDFVRRAFDVLLCSHKTEEGVLDSILMPLAAEMWPHFINEPGQIEFTGIGRFRFGKPISSRVNKSKHGKPITDFSTLKEQIKPAIRSRMRFRRLLGQDSMVPMVKSESPPKTKT